MSERTRTMIVLAGVGGLCWGLWQFGAFGAMGGATDGLVMSQHGSDAWPKAPADAAATPVGRPPRGVGRSTAYAFVKRQPRSEAPVAYDPCVPIHVVVNDRTAFAGGARLVGEAIEEVERATGLVFVIDGRTSEAPSAARASRSPRYGEGWAPVLLSWTSPEETPQLEGAVAGLAGSAAASRNGHLWNVTGGVMLDGPQLREIARWPGGRADARAVIMHEFGHLVGLAHVPDAGQIMQPKGEHGLTSWGEGDRAGLAALGAGECVHY